jgi:hypothetical protein
MAKKNTGILTWQAPSEVVVKQAPPQPLPKRTCLSNPGRDIPESAVLHTLLKPNGKQTSVLDAMFSGPVLIRDLLQKAVHNPKTLEDASLFLLSNHRALQPYLYATDRSRSVELLKHFIAEWAISSPELIELEFPSDCSISAANHVSFPIPKLGTILVNDEQELHDQRRGMKYSPGFVLIHSPWGYIAEIQFARAQRRFETEVTLSAPLRKPKLKPKAQKRPDANTGRISFDQFLFMFDNVLNARLMDEIRVSKKFVTPDFDSLQGWSVAGGLPSLGKHR